MRNTRSEKEKKAPIVISASRDWTVAFLRCVYARVKVSTWGSSSGCSICGTRFVAWAPSGGKVSSLSRFAFDGVGKWCDNVRELVIISLSFVTPIKSQVSDLIVTIDSNKLVFHVPGVIFWLHIADSPPATSGVISQLLIAPSGLLS